MKGLHSPTTLYPREHDRRGRAGLSSFPHLCISTREDLSTAFTSKAFTARKGQETIEGQFPREGLAGLVIGFPHDFNARQGRSILEQKVTEGGGEASRMLLGGPKEAEHAYHRLCCFEY